MKRIRKDWLVGFIEGEGTIGKSNRYNKPVFDITQHIADVNLMERIRYYIGGSAGIQMLKDNTCKLTVTDRKEIRDKVLPLLYNQLYTEKKVRSIEEKWGKIEDIAKEIKLMGGNIKGEGGPSKDWVQGFTDAEGSFYLTISKNKEYRVGYQVRARFNIRQYNEERLLNKVNEKYFGEEGRVDLGGLTIESLRGLKKYVIPFYITDIKDEGNGLMTRKKRDFRLWLRGIRLIEEGRHRDKEGLEMIRSIRLKMDLNRKGLISRP